MKKTGNRIRARDIRSSLNNHQQLKEPCFICKEHHEISEKHHLITLAECAFWMNNSYHMPDLKIKVPIIRLCPNHHKYFHLIMNGLEFPDCLPDTCIDKYKELLSMRIVWFEEFRKQMENG